MLGDRACGLVCCYPGLLLPGLLLPGFAFTGGVENEELSSHSRPCRHASRRACGGSLRRADPVVAAFSTHRQLLVLANRYPRCRSRQTSACNSSSDRSRSRKAAPVSAGSTDHQLLVLANR